MAKRTGVPTIHNLAKRMCRKLAQFSPIIKALYPDDLTLIAALTAAEIACSELAYQVGQVREYGD
jgi:hypothetical protein